MPEGLKAVTTRTTSTACLNGRSISRYKPASVAQSSQQSLDLWSCPRSVQVAARKSEQNSLRPGLVPLTTACSAVSCRDAPGQPVRSYAYRQSMCHPWTVPLAIDSVNLTRHYTTHEASVKAKRPALRHQSPCYTICTTITVALYAALASYSQQDGTSLCCCLKTFTLQLM